MPMKARASIFVVATLLMAASCATPANISYLQDIEPGVATELSPAAEIKIQPEDKISIVVNSKDPVLADMFNLPIISHRVGYSEMSSLNQSQQVSSYTVDAEGEIDFPILGKIKVGGLSRSEIATLIKDRLIGEQLINDPVVTVEFANLYVSVLGEVNKPGRYSIDRDRLSILDAIGMAGDLTIFGQRDKVLVLREENGKQVSYALDLTSANSLYSSPAFYLKQKDVVYIEPNDTRKRQSTVNGNNVRSTSFWVSLGSMLTSVAALILNIAK